MKRAIATLAIAASLLTACHGTKHEGKKVTIYSTPNLTGKHYSVSVDDLVITPSLQGGICLALDRNLTTETDTSYYLTCGAATGAGAHVDGLN